MRNDEQRASWALEVLTDLWPEGSAQLAALLEAGLLHQDSLEPGASVFQSLYRTLTLPRAPGLHPWNICRTVCTRILEPATNTQKIAVPFAGKAELSSMTCSAAVRLNDVMSEAPAEYARWAEQLTSPLLHFHVTRVFADNDKAKSVQQVLAQYCPTVLLGSRMVRLLVMVDADALGRAIVEQFHLRLWAGEGSKETRSALDVLAQSALMNFMMRGAYNSSTDSHRWTGEGGVAFDDLSVQWVDNIVLRSAAGLPPIIR